MHMFQSVFFKALWDFMVIPQETQYQEHHDSLPIQAQARSSASVQQRLPGDNGIFPALNHEPEILLIYWQKWLPHKILTFKGSKALRSDKFCMDSQNKSFSQASKQFSHLPPIMTEPLCVLKDSDMVSHDC